jgi:hypothetical protein
MRCCEPAQTSLAGLASVEQLTVKKINGMVGGVNTYFGKFEK